MGLAARPGRGVPAVHDNAEKRDGWRFGDRRRLIAPTATSGPGAGGGRPLGGAKGVVGAACVVSLGGSGCKRKGLPGLMGVRVSPRPARRRAPCV